MQTIKIDKPPYLINGDKVLELNVAEINFSKFIECVRSGQSKSRKDDDISKNIIRERIKSQASAKIGSGDLIKLDDVAISQMPRQYAIDLIDKLDVFKDGGGEILSKGDGITTPAHYKFATPLRGGDGKKIPEVEFKAATFGDIEDVISAPSNLEKTVALLSKCAKPIGSDANLIVLPSWAVESVSMADGYEIMEKILPDFIK